MEPPERDHIASAVLHADRPVVTPKEEDSQLPGAALAACPGFRRATLKRISSSNGIAGNNTRPDG
jgi:hypothetical protein